MDSGIYIKDEHDGEEIRRAIQISTMGLDFGAPATFNARAADTFSGDWGDWIDGRWTPFFALHIVKAYTKSKAFEVDEIVKLDAVVGAFLDSDESERSLSAGAAMREAAWAARHNRVMKKFFEAGGEEEMVGHAATVFAMQAAEFNLPLFSTLISYLFFEWKSGALRVAERDFVADEQRFTADAMRGLGGIRELLRKYLGDLEPAACA